MITTVITVSTITTMAALGLTSTTSMAAVVALIVFLGARELASAGHSRFSLRLAKLLTIGICTLAMAFAVILATKIVELL